MINELMQGYEHAKQLQSVRSPSAATELQIQSILSSIGKAINMLMSRDCEGETQPTDSPHSISGSPHSENSNGTTFREDECRVLSKKRKMVPKWTEQIRVSAGSSLEGPPDDGHSWRKYGQKDILGAKYPRAYYRCTHKHLQGCLAKKQVQRSEEDPSIFNIMYQGTHTCMQAPHLASPKLQEKQQQQHPQQQLLINFRTGLKVKTEDLDTTQDLNSSSFSFPPAMDCGNSTNCIFSSKSMDNHFMGSFSPPFISPATSESNYFSVSPCHQMSSYGGGPNMQTPESELNEIISAMTTASNSSLGDLDFHFDEFDPNLQFDTNSFLS